MKSKKDKRLYVLHYDNGETYTFKAKEINKLFNKTDTPNVRKMCRFNSIPVSNTFKRTYVERVE